MTQQDRRPAAAPTPAQERLRVRQLDALVAGYLLALRRHDGDRRPGEAPPARRLATSGARP
jgi:hypothetical protein